MSRPNQRHSARELAVRNRIVKAAFGDAVMVCRREGVETEESVNSFSEQAVQWKRNHYGRSAALRLVHELERIAVGPVPEPEKPAGCSSQQRVNDKP